MLGMLYIVCYVLKAVGQLVLVTTGGSTTASGLLYGAWRNGSKNTEIGANQMILLTLFDYLYSLLWIVLLDGA